MAKQPVKLVLTVGVVAIILSLLLRFGPMIKPGVAHTITSSSLMKTIDIAELSTAEFRYRGIANVYTNDRKTDVRCRICYDAIVKAGIDMHQVKFDVDTEHKTVTATLPEIDLKVMIVDDQPMSVIPSHEEVRLDRMLKYSKADAESEARASGALISAARENLKATIEGLLYPVLKTQGYELTWE